MECGDFPPLSTAQVADDALEKNGINSAESRPQQAPPREAGRGFQHRIYTVNQQHTAFHKSRRPLAEEQLAMLRSHQASPPACPVAVTLVRSGPCIL